PDCAVHLPGDVPRDPRARVHQPDALPEMSPETESGFGSGLRAQLRRKQGEPDQEVVAAEGGHADADGVLLTIEDYLALEPTQPAERDWASAEPIAAVSVAAPPELSEARAQLEDALRREQELRDALQHHVEAYERELDAGRDLALREAETAIAADRVADR